MLEPRRLLAATPSIFEQYMLELINRARGNPTAEAARLGIDLNEGLAAGTISTAAVPPLAFNPALIQAAQGYTNSLLGAYNYFDHQFNGTTLQGRLGTAGYNLVNPFTFSENLTVEDLPPGHGHTPLTVNQGSTDTQYSNLFIDSGASTRGDRLNLLSTMFREIGIGVGSTNIYEGLDSPPDHTNYSAVLTTQDFGTTAVDPNPFLTGVAFTDVAHTQFYAPGEGIGSVNITATRASDGMTFSATTWSSGGYSLAVLPGTYAVVASGGTLSAPIALSNIVVGTDNLEADFIDTGPKHLAIAQPPVSTTTSTTLSPITVDIEDSTGATITSDNSNVTLALGIGPTGATIGGTTTVAAVSGVATFSNLSFPTAGNYSLVATDGTFTSATSPAFTITSSAPAETIGGLDPAFGVGGLASHNVGFTSTAGVALDGTQSVLIGTLGSAPNESLGITRYNADGSVDTNFGVHGVASVSFAGFDAAPKAVQVLPGGQILVAGTATKAGGSEFAIAELNADGSPDTGFGGGTGQALVSFSSTGTLTNDLLQAMVVSTGGAIYLGGSSNATGTTGTDFAVAALNADGTPNTGFATGGKALQDFAGGDDAINSLAIQINGEVVAAGTATIGGVAEIALERLLPAGTLDSRFGTKGLVTTNVRGVYDSAASVVIQPKGQIVIGGLSATGSASALSSDFVLARYTATGKLDKSFGGTGTVITSFGQPSAISQLVLQSDGGIIASGKTTPSLTNVVPNSLDVAIARYTTRGILDTSFNGTGKTTISLSGAVGTESLASVMIEPLDASSLGAAFAAFTSSQQGAVAATPGGEILSVGNSGANTVEAAIITAGVNLVTRLIGKLPTSAVEGAKGLFSVKIAETGGVIAKGTFTLEVFASTDGQVDAGQTPLLSIPEKINFKARQSKTFKLHYTLPSTAGNFYLLARINTGSAHSLQAGALPAISATAVEVAPPFVDLAGSKLMGTPVVGALTSISISVANKGNVLASAVPVEILASTDGTVANGTMIAQPTLRLGLQPGITRTYKLSFKIPATLAANTYVLVVDLDPANTLGDPTPADNVIVGQIPFAVG